MLNIHLLGPFSVEHDDRRLGPRDFGGVKPKQLLEVLLLERGHPVPKDRLADLLWGESLPRKVSATLETYISVLRRHLQPGSRTGSSAIITEPGAYRFDTTQATVDIDRFDKLVDRARREPSRVSRRTLEEAISIVRGELLEDEPYASWAEDHRHHYHERFLQALNDAAEAALAEREFAVALEHAHRSVGVDRLSERGYRIAMLASYALGRQGDALRAYERCRKVLCDELGVDPLPETKSVYQAIITHDDVAHILPSAPAERVVTRRPSPARSTLLGRAEELAQLRDVIDRSRHGAFSLALVEGESGIGKTRLLDELADSLEIPVGRARCSQLERELPYVPIAAALRDLLHAFSIDPLTVPSLSPILPEIGGGPVPQIHAFEAMVGIADTHAPFAIVIDDLHWADDESLAALAYLQRRCAQAPIAIIASYRADVAGRDHMLHRLQPAAHLRLDSLKAVDVAALNDPALFEQTGGHPLFIDARLNDTGTERLHRLVADRTAQAGPFGQRLLEAAAVLQDPFDPEPVAAIVEAGTDEVLDGLEALCTRGLLQTIGEGFGFRQQAVRDVLAAALSPARRRIMLQRATPTFASPVAAITTEDPDSGALIVDLRDAVADVLGERAPRPDNVRPFNTDTRNRHPSAGLKDSEPEPK